jgi:hypothetical protein
MTENDLPKEFKRFEDELRLRDKQIESLRTVSDGLNESKYKLEKSMAEIKENKAYIDDLKKSQIEKDLKINEIETRLNEKTRENEELKQKNEILKIQVDNYSKDKLNTNTTESDEINNLKSNIIDLQQKIAILTVENDTLHNDLKTTKYELQNSNDEKINLIKANTKLEANSFAEENLIKVTKELEESEKLCSQYSNEKAELEHKLQNLKSTLHEIKEKFELELSKKEKANQEHNVNDLLKKIKALEDYIRAQKKIVSNFNKEKMELEEIILKQEEKVSELGTKFNLIDKLVKEKNKELKENEGHITQLVNIIEEQKRTISIMTRSNSNMNEEAPKSKSRNYYSGSKKETPNRTNKDALPPINVKHPKYNSPTTNISSKKIDNLKTKNVEENSDRNLVEITNMMNKILEDY